MKEEFDNMFKSQNIDFAKLFAEWEKERKEQIADMSPNEVRLFNLQLEKEEKNAEVGKLNEVDCDICKNKGYYYEIPNDIAYKLVCVECECMKARRSIRLIEKSGLSNVIKTKTFAEYKVEKSWQGDIKKMAIDYVKHGGNNWFIICGQSGCGKSHICTAIVGEMLKQMKRVIYLPYRDEIPKLKRHAIDDEYYSKKIESWENCEILYIDDLFKGIRKENAMADIAIIFELIDYRCRENKRTIISTECLIEDLLNLDEAIGGRIIEMCGKYKAEIEKNKDKNYRMKDLY